ncbi:MAG: biotin/lipoyl-binding protein, partial [Gammaproteobacteria bacterium]
MARPVTGLQVAPQDPPLPALRDDLTLIQGAPALDDTPTWNIFDPVRNRYYRIGWLPFQLISRWASGTVNTLLERVHAESACDVRADDIADIVEFLYANGLTRDPPGGDTSAYVSQYKASRIHIFKWLVHHYLFFKIPLVRPTRFLKATQWLVEPLFTHTARNTVLACGAIGLYLAARQWDEFARTFLHFFSLEGLLLYGVALAFVKICHELGHAYTAIRYRCNVPTMGLAFLVMFPVLYTDATDAWRLRSRRQRLYIGAAGMIVELGIAMISTFLWTFLPDGPARSAAFLTATTSWVVSLTVNLNPFMRFDGYYMLSDWWGVQSLQNRAFAIGKWQLRELLFKANLAAPETFERPLRLRLTLYAWATWVYRLSLFLAIALLVYHLFFKVLGIFLFLVEIIWLISLPIAREVCVWWEKRDTIMRTKRFVVTVSIVLGLGLITLIPWSGRISLPALLETAEHTTVYAPAPGRIATVKIRPGQQVEAGDVLIVLESPEIDNQL